MPRLAGVDIPTEKQTQISLTYIHGIGRGTARKMLTELGIDESKRARDLSEDELSRLASYIDKNLQVEGGLRRQVSQNVSRLKDIAAYRGLRHRRGLPVRGQRTKTNARTRKGKKRTIPVKRQVGKA